MFRNSKEKYFQHRNETKAKAVKGNKGLENNAKTAFLRSIMSSRCVLGALLAMLVIFAILQTSGICPTSSFTLHPNSKQSSYGKLSSPLNSFIKSPDSNPSPKRHPHTSYPIAPLHCPPKSPPTTNTYTIHLDITYSIPEHIGFLTQRISNSIVLEEPQNIRVPQDGSTVFTLGAVNDKLLALIRKDPGVWYVECEDGKELRGKNGELKS